MDSAASRSRGARVRARLAELHSLPSHDHVPADGTPAADSAPAAPPAPPDAARRLAGRVRFHLSNGSVSRAARCISNQPAADVTDTVLEQLRALHPAEALPALPPQTVPAVVVTADDLNAVLRRLPAGSAPGPSGWTYEHIRAAATSSPAAHDSVLRVVNLLVSGSLPHIPALVASHLIALRKPGGRGIRPLAVGEVWLRLAGLCAMQACPSATSTLAPLQLAVGVRGGAQCLGHGISAALRSDPTNAVLQVDWRNAFNEVRREEVLRAVADRAPALLPFAVWSYGSHAPCDRASGKGTRAVRSALP